MYKTYSSAPLPFMGQKRRFVRDFKEVLKQFGDVDVIVDLFGGSGLLAHVAKRECPEKRVVYNDFDGFCDRLANVSVTNEILRRLRPIMATVPPNKRVPKEQRDKMLSIISEYEEKGCHVDYITLSASILFSGKWVTTYQGLTKQTMYNMMRLSDYEVDGYLDGLEVVHADYREVFAAFPDKKRTLFLIDPPYLSTEVGSYECYWKLGDYLDVLKLLVETRYIYFTSNKSQIVELCWWLNDNAASLGNPFKDAEIHKRYNNLNYNAGFTDMMLVKG